MHRKVGLDAHVGHQGVNAVKHLEDRADAFLPMRLHGTDVTQVKFVYSSRGVFQITRVMLRSVGAKRPSFSLPRPCLTTLACHRAQTTSETAAGLKPWPLLGVPAVSTSAASRVKFVRSLGKSVGSVLTARANSLTNEHIFFSPIPGVLDNSVNDVLSRSFRVRPRKAKGSRRSVGQRPVSQWLF